MTTRIRQKSANAFAAALLTPADGLRDMTAGRPVDETALSRLMRHFGVSYSALLYRLAAARVGLLSLQARAACLGRPVSAVLRAANDPAPDELTMADEARRIPARLWRSAQAGYQTGRVGIGTLAALVGEPPEQLFVRLAAGGVRPPESVDDLARRAN